MDANGKNQKNLTKTGAFPSWSSDGEHIAFTSDKNGNSEIYVMDADGKNQKNLTKNPHTDTTPAWFGSAFAVAPASKKLTMWGWFKQVDR